MQPVNTSTFVETPKMLTKLTRETISIGLPELNQHFKNNHALLKDIFKNYILNIPLNKNLLFTINKKVLNGEKIKEDSVLAKRIVLLHTIFNDPDSLRVSNINKDLAATNRFRAEMVQIYKTVKETVANLSTPVKSPFERNKGDLSTHVSATKKRSHREEEEKPFRQIHRKLDLNLAAPDQSNSIELSRSFHLPPNSSGIILNRGNNIEVGSHCFNIKVTVGKSSLVNIHDGCKNIEVYADKNSRVIIQRNCSDIHINIEMPSEFKIGYNCRNIYLNGEKIK